MAVADLDDEIFQIKHMALRNALYHVARRRFLDGINRFCNLLVILGGTAVVAEMARGAPAYSLLVGCTVTTIGALQLVFDYSGRARQHEILQRRYFNLMADVECVEAPSGEQCVRWRSEFSRAAADEPPTLRALDAIADNQATFALIGGDKPRLKITRWQSLTRHIWAHNSGAFPLDDIEAHSNRSVVA